MYSGYAWVSANMIYIFGEETSSTTESYRMVPDLLGATLKPDVP